ncbi:MAG: hypothetical protein H8D26_09565 [Methanomicrobia archaeon]|nr:hypothetical protein [Methanomicrobia archaeon]
MIPEPDLLAYGYGPSPGPDPVSILIPLFIFFWLVWWLVSCEDDDN